MPGLQTTPGVVLRQCQASSSFLAEIRDQHVFEAGPVSVCERLHIHLTGPAGGIVAFCCLEWPRHLLAPTLCNLRIHVFCGRPCTRNMASGSSTEAQPLYGQSRPNLLSPVSLLPERAGQCRRAGCFPIVSGNRSLSLGQRFQGLAEPCKHCV